MDVLYLCFSSGMSGTIRAANMCMEELRQDYLERKIICIDALCASVGEGFLVREAAKKKIVRLHEEEGRTYKSITAEYSTSEWFVPTWEELTEDVF